MKYLLVSLALVIMSGCISPPSLPQDEADLLRKDLDFLLINKKSGSFYTVKHGDTLWDIAQRYKITLNQLKKVNQDVLKGSNMLSTGMRLFIPGRVVAEADFIWPLQGQVIGRASTHGINIKAFMGQEVRATKSGKVTFVSDRLRGYGKTVIINHQDGFVSMYAYHSEILVKLGDKVKQGQVIARAGKTGRPDEPQLHFRLTRHDKPVNPLDYLH